MDPFDTPTVAIQIRLRGHTFVKAIGIDPRSARCLEPLDKDHDFPGMLDAQRDALRQMEERRALASVIASALTAAIMEAATSNDPHNGYTPEQNREFQTSARHY